MTIRLPFEKAHDIKYVATNMYLEPENGATEVSKIANYDQNQNILVGLQVRAPKKFSLSSNLLKYKLQG